MGYLDEILGYQQQGQITGRGKLTPGQVEAAFEGDISARTKAAATSRGQDIQQQSVDIQGAAEKAQEGQFAITNAQNEKTRASQQAGQETQSLITAGGILAGMFNAWNQPKQKDTIININTKTEAMLDTSTRTGGAHSTEVLQKASLFTAPTAPASPESFAAYVRNLEASESSSEWLKPGWIGQAQSSYQSDIMAPYNAAYSAYNQLESQYDSTFQAFNVNYNLSPEAAYTPNYQTGIAGGGGDDEGFSGSGE